MIPELNDKYWNDRYINNEFGWDVGDVSSPLKDYFLQLTNKNSSILIPGAGNSYEAEWLVNNGFENVYVCDFAEEPLKNLKQRCPKIKSENLLQIDFFEINSKPVTEALEVTNTIFQSESRQDKLSNKTYSFDLIIEQTFFCAINPILRKKYFEKMHSLLKPRGKLIGVLFNDPMNIDHPPFGGTSEEYRKYFEKLFKINVYQACYNSIKPRAGKELFINLEKI